MCSYAKLWELLGKEKFRRNSSKSSAADRKLKERKKSKNKAAPNTSHRISY